VPAFVHETPHEPAFERPLNPPTAEAEYPAPAAPQASAESSVTEAHAPASEEAPRRRSTVREPAPLSGEAAAAPVPSPASSPTPVISVSSGEETAPPKRGWWGKRLLGNKG
jgi:ribonuclease E